MVSPPTFLLDCLGLGPGSSSRPSSPTTLSPSKKPTTNTTSSPSTSCVFCNPTTERGFDIILASERYVAFTDRSPAAALHLLVVPRKHVPNVKSLRGVEDARMVQEMKDFGSRALDLAVGKRMGNGYGAIDEKGKHTGKRYGDDPGPRRYGFHIPPFRSVEHLHLHCLQLPFTSPLKALKYHVAHPARGSSSSPSSSTTGSSSATLNGTSNDLESQQSSKNHSRNTKATYGHKGWSWFVQWQQAADILKDGGQVKVTPC